MNKIYKTSLIFCSLVISLLIANFVFADKGYFIDKNNKLSIFDNAQFRGYLSVGVDKEGLAGDLLVNQDLNQFNGGLYVCKDQDGNESCTNKILTWSGTSINVNDSAFYRAQLNNINGSLTVPGKTFMAGPIKITNCLGVGTTCGGTNILSAATMNVDGFSPLTSDILNANTGTKYRSINLGPESNLGVQRVCYFQTEGTGTAYWTSGCESGAFMGNSGSAFPNNGGITVDTNAWDYSNGGNTLNGGYGKRPYDIRDYLITNCTVGLNDKYCVGYCFMGNGNANACTAYLGDFLYDCKKVYKPFYPTATPSTNPDAITIAGWIDAASSDVSESLLCPTILASSRNGQNNTALGQINTYISTTLSTCRANYLYCYSNQDYLLTTILANVYILKNSAKCIVDPVKIRQAFVGRADSTFVCFKKSASVRKGMKLCCHLKITY